LCCTYLTWYFACHHSYPNVTTIGVRAGKFLEVRRIFDQVSPNLPEKLLCDFFAYKFSPTKIMKTFFGVTSKKRVFICFSPNVGHYFLKLNTHWAPFLPRFSGILPRYLRILPGFLTNQNFWGCACNPASYTTGYKP